MSSHPDPDATKRWRRRVLAALALAAVTSAGAEASSGETAWRQYRQSELETRLQKEQRRYLGVLNEPAIQAGLYVLPAGAVDRQEPHDQDEVYVITAGRAVLRVAEQQTPVEPGSIVFVRAGVPHRFVEIETQLHSLVLFSGAESNPADPAWAATTLDQARRSAKADSNEWVRFFDFQTLNLGLYMLPKPLGGDSPLTHQVDELNVVTKGEAVMQVGEDQLPVGPGSVVWVQAGRPHSFHSLEDDFDVLIMFHQKPGVTTP